MVNDLTTPNGFLEANDSEYVRLVSLISDVWEKAKGKAAIAVNTELLDANWQTGRYIVEYEQNGNVKAEYGKQLLTNLSRDLTRLRGKGYSQYETLLCAIPKNPNSVWTIDVEPLSGVAQMR